MSDIFISYSRKDSRQAIELAERLRVDGMDVWIDQRGIVGAEQWATEIVEGIRSCSTFIILLSPSSIESENVLRELSLASEKRKRVLPVDLEPTVLPSSFEYPLAGLQRVAISDFNSILHAHKHGVDKVTHKDERKSLMILPFEDLSPTGDNAWFADGIASELISALSHVKSIRIADNQTTKEFKKYNGLLTTYAREMNYRYFVQGEVRKFGDQIKISSRLLDIETGDHLWQDSMKGTMNNIFEIQEAVALKVVEGLKVHLASDEKKKLAERGTENAEAYELFMKALEYYHLLTKDGIQLALQLLTETINLDSGYANAYASKAYILSELYGIFNRDPKLLEEGIQLVNEALRLKPDLWEAYKPLSNLYRLQGKIMEGEMAAKAYTQNAPNDSGGYLALGYFYMNTGQFHEAIAPYEEVLKINPENWNILFNLVIAYSNAKDIEKQKIWATNAVLRYKRLLKLFPEDENKRVDMAILLQFAGRDDEARSAASSLENIRDGGALHNVACLQSELGDYEKALRTSRRSIEAGYQNVQLLVEFLNVNVIKLKGTPEYDEVREMVEKLEVEEKQNV